MVQMATLTAERTNFAAGELPMIEVVFPTIIYMIPRWSPDKARMCDAPEILNASVILPGRSALLPHRSAFNRALISRSLKLIASIDAWNAFLRAESWCSTLTSLMTSVAVKKVIHIVLMAFLKRQRFMISPCVTRR